MVKTKNPLFSSDAIGKLGTSLQFGHWKGRTVAGRKRNPEQPRTLAQRATRIYMTWLNNQWRSLAASQVATWEAAPNPRGLPLYNVYLSYNMNRIKHLLDLPIVPYGKHAFPTQTYPATETGTLATWTVGTKTPLSRGVRWERDIGPINQQWGFLWFLKIPGVQRVTYNTLIHAETTHAAGPFTSEVYNLPPGLQTIQFVTFTKTGYTKNWAWNFNVTILP